MASPEEENHAAKKTANGKLREFNDAADELTATEVDNISNDEDDDLQDFKDKLEEATDAIQEDINAHRISAADRKLRELRDILRGRGARSDPKVKDAKRTPMEKLLKDVRTAKRDITAPVVADAAADLPGFVDLDDFADVLVDDVTKTVSSIPISELGLSPAKMELLSKLRLASVGDVLESKSRC